MENKNLNSHELSEDQLEQAGGGLGTHINYLPQNDLVTGSPEMSDDELDQIVGGYGVGDTLLCSRDDIDYCSNCGRILKNYEVTITGVRGVLDGHALYWVTRNCCGHKSSIIDTEILG